MKYSYGISISPRHRQKYIIFITVFDISGVSFYIISKKLSWLIPEVWRMIHVNISHSWSNKSRTWYFHNKYKNILGKLGNTVL